MHHIIQDLGYGNNTLSNDWIDEWIKKLWNTYMYTQSNTMYFLKIKIKQLAEKLDGIGRYLDT